MTHKSSTQTTLAMEGDREISNVPMFHLTLCSGLWLGPEQRAPDGMDSVWGQAWGCVMTASWHFARLGLHHILPRDPGPRRLAKLFKYCTLLVNRHNILKVLQSNIYAARKHFTLSLNSHVIYLFSISDLSILYQN